MTDPQSSGLIHRKIATLRAVYGRGGAGAVLRHSATRLAFFVRSRWVQGVQWSLGKLVELRGDCFLSDGLTFTLDNPRISIREKSNFFRGAYEVDERRMVARFLDPGLPAIEIGACIGIVSCMTNRRLEDPERHVVIEANPYLIPTLEANRDRNGCRFTILNGALAYGQPNMAFSIHESFVGSSVQRKTSEQVEVPTTTLRGILESRGFDVVNLIFDAEGAEVELLEHEADVLEARVARLIIELHGRLVGVPAIARVVERLEALGFALEERSDGPLVDSSCAFVNRSLEAARRAGPSPS